jgi:hypothetical protein
MVPPLHRQIATSPRQFYTPPQARDYASTGSTGSMYPVHRRGAPPIETARAPPESDPSDASDTECLKIAIF